MALATGTGSDNGIPIKNADRLELGDSVTQGDIFENNGLMGAGFNGVGIINLWLGGGFGYGPLGESELLPPLPPYWSLARDKVLSTTIDFEDFWSDAVSIAIDKGASSAFEVKGASDLAARKGMELFNDHTNGGQGWANFVSAHLQDYFLTDKGAFIEIDRVDNSMPGSKVTGLYHLDSLRCYLTGDPDKPVIYMDLHGEFHYLTWWQVFHISDKPNPRNNFFKVGKCAASRSFRMIRRMVAADIYDYDEMTGRKATKMLLIQGTTQQQIEGWIASDKTNRAMQPATIHGNVALSAILAKEGLDTKEILIREKPKDWNDETQLEHAAIKYSASLGMDKAEIKPFTGRMAGTATMSEVQHNKQEGKGLSVWRGGIQWFMTEFVLPTQASFHWNEYDASAKKAKADLFNTYAGAVNTLTGGAPILTPVQGVQVLVDEEQLAKEYQPKGEDITPNVTLADDEKPLEPATPATDTADALAAQARSQAQQLGQSQPLLAPPLPQATPKAAGIGSLSGTPSMQKLLTAMRGASQKRPLKVS